jgi:hypothetical protein
MWNDKSEVKKGNVGERIALEILKHNEYIVYAPITEGAHKVDYFAHKISIEKSLIAVKIKSKKRLYKFEATGIDTTVLKHYMELYEKHKIDTYLYFIDDFEKCIYGQWLSELEQRHYDKNGEWIGGTTGRKIENKNEDLTVWWLGFMVFERWLTAEELLELSKNTTEYCDYSKVEKYWTEENIEKSYKYKKL